MAELRTHSSAEPVTLIVGSSLDTEFEKVREENEKKWKKKNEREKKEITGSRQQPSNPKARHAASMLKGKLSRADHGS